MDSSSDILLWCFLLWFRVSGCVGRGFRCRKQFIRRDCESGNACAFVFGWAFAACEDEVDAVGGGHGDLWIGQFLQGRR